MPLASAITKIVVAFEPLRQNRSCAATGVTTSLVALGAIRCGQHRVTDDATTRVEVPDMDLPDPSHPEADAAAAVDDAVLAQSLVEEVSIDGMCGVY